MPNATCALLLAAVFGVAAAPVAAAAAEDDGRIQVRSQREDAGARVRQVERSGGRVLQAEPMQRGGEEVYRFKVLTPEGRVRVLQDDDRRDLTDRRRAFRDDARAADAGRPPREREIRGDADSRQDLGDSAGD